MADGLTGLVPQQTRTHWNALKAAQQAGGPGNWAKFKAAQVRPGQTWEQFKTAQGGGGGGGPFPDLTRPPHGSAHQGDGASASAADLTPPTAGSGRPWAAGTSGYQNAGLSGLARNPLKIYNDAAPGSAAAIGRDRYNQQVDYLTYSPTPEWDAWLQSNGQGIRQGAAGMLDSGEPMWLRNPGAAAKQAQYGGLPLYFAK